MSPIRGMSFSRGQCQTALDQAKPCVFLAQTKTYFIKLWEKKSQIRNIWLCGPCLYSLFYTWKHNFFFLLLSLSVLSLSYCRFLCGLASPAKSWYELQMAVGAGMIKEESSILRNLKEHWNPQILCIYCTCILRMWEGQECRGEAPTLSY